MNNDDLFKEYDFALVRLVIFVPYKDKSQVPKLVGATITLMTSDREKVARPKDSIFVRLERNGGTLYFDYFITNVDDGIVLYRSDSGLLKERIPLLENESREVDSKPILGSNWSDFPEWPVIGVEAGSGSVLSNSSLSESIPFKNKTLIRYHRRLTADLEWDINDTESLGYKIINSARALEFLEHMLGIDFLKYYEYLGGMSLIVPDFQLMSFKMFVEPNNDGTESIVVQLLPRRGKELKNISVLIITIQSGVLSGFEKLPVSKSGLVTFKRRSYIDSAGLIVLHEKYGVVYQQPITPFMRNMSFDINVVGEKQIINAPLTDKKNSQRFNYIANLSSSTGVTKIGEQLSSAESKVYEAKYARLLLKNAKKFGQAWFGADERETALNVVHKKIERAKNKVVIIDPYFGASQVGQTLYKVRNNKVKIEILTTKKAIDSTQSANNLQQSLEKFQEHKNGIMPQVYISKDKTMDFHDRFLIIDNESWLLGSSLNMIGSQPTMILRVPNPKIILDYIEKFKAKAISFSDYIDIDEKISRDSKNDPSKS